MKKECYYAALTLALTVPDICGKAEYEGMRNKERYITWYDENIGKVQKELGKLDDGTPFMPYLSGKLVYNLRCNVLHAGVADLDKDKISEERNQITKFILRIPQKSRAKVYGAEFNTEYQYTNNVKSPIRIYEVDIPLICNLIANCAEEFYSKNKDNIKLKFPNDTIVLRMY